MADLRIAHVVGAFGGGVGTALRALLPTQVRAGDAVTLFAGSIAPHEAANLRAARVVLKPLEGARALTGLLRQYDVVHLHGADLRLLLAAWASRVPTVMTLHGRRAVTRPLSTLVTGGGLPTARGVLRRARRLALAFCLRRLVTQVVVVSEFLAQSATSLYGLSASDIVVIRHGLPSDVFAASSPSRSGGYALGWSGRLVTVKRVDLLLRAVAAIVRDDPRSQCSLVLMGDGVLRADLEQMTRALGLADVVRFTGRVDDVPRRLTELDIFILPSCGEGLSYSVAEALAVGVPVVVMADSGGAEELVRLSGGGLVACDERDLTAKIRHLMDDRERRELLGRRGREFALRELQPVPWAEKYRSVYLSVVRGRA